MSILARLTLCDSIAACRSHPVHTQHQTCRCAAITDAIASDRSLQLNATRYAVSIACIPKTFLGSEMCKSQRQFLTAILMVAMPIAACLALSSPALSASCSAMTHTCLQRSNAPDKVARCTAAGESCAKSFVFVGPYNGKSYPADKHTSRGCARYTRNKACY
jgi:hypothetical protein